MQQVVGPNLACFEDEEHLSICDGVVLFEFGRRSVGLLPSKEVLLLSGPCDADSVDEYGVVNDAKRYPTLTRYSMKQAISKDLIFATQNSHEQEVCLSKPAQTGSRNAQ